MSHLVLAILTWIALTAGEPSASASMPMVREMKTLPNVKVPATHEEMAELYRDNLEPDFQAWRPEVPLNITHIYTLVSAAGCCLRLRDQRLRGAWDWTARFLT